MILSHVQYESFIDTSCGTLGKSFTIKENQKEKINNKKGANQPMQVMREGFTIKGWGTRLAKGLSQKFKVS